MAEQQQQVEQAKCQDEKPIVIAVDGSENAKYAFDWYKQNVYKHNNKVYLVHVVEINDVLHSTQWYNSPYSFDKEVLTKLLEEEKEKIRHKLQGFAVWLQESGTNGTVKSIHATSPGEGIINAAKEVDAQLIVVGTRGMGKIRRTLLGSVSDYILHHAHVPVLICRHDK